MKKKKNAKFIPYLLLLLVLVMSYYFMQSSMTTNLDYNGVNQVLETQKIEEISIEPTEYVVVIEGYYLKDNKKVYFTGKFPNTQNQLDTFTQKVKDDKIPVVNIVDKNQSSFFWSLIITVLPFILMIGLLVFFVSKSGGGQNKAFDFGKSRASLTDPNAKKVTFNDVAGCEEEKAELAELVDYLKTPNKFTALGARIPRGVLLSGPPGTGKTLLARAVAGEANVPFYSISGSDFVEMFVGVGASRVRDMFKTAKQNAPCILFIDEIDAVGRQRGAGVGGGHDEREQTLNQLLVEMDGFSDNSGIIMIAATNRPDVLDPALLRPGRFDRSVTVALPDKKGRVEILKVHARNKKFAPGVTLENIGERTPGFSGADLENLLNEAALLAVRFNKTQIDLEDIDESIDRVVGGPAKKSRKHNPRELQTVAYHEAGHALIGLLLDDAEIVQKVTIIPRGDAGGYVLMTPKEETYLQTRKGLEARIIGLLAGRVAEEIKFNDISTGAYSDIEKATRIARAMVTEYGMSKLGPIQYEQPRGSIFLGRDYNSSKNFSDTVAFEIDEAVREIIQTCYEQAQKLITEHSELHELIATTLLTKETLTREEIQSLFTKGCLPEAEVVEVVETQDTETVETVVQEIKAVEEVTTQVDESEVTPNDRV